MFYDFLACLLRYGVEEEAGLWIQWLSNSFHPKGSSISSSKHLLE